MLFPWYQFLWTGVHNDSQQGGTERATTRSFLPGGASQCCCLLCSNLKCWLNGTHHLNIPFSHLCTPGTPGMGMDLCSPHPTLPTAGVCESVEGFQSLDCSHDSQHCSLEGWTGGLQASGQPSAHPPVKALGKRPNLSEVLNLGMFSSVLLIPQPPNSEVQCSGEDTAEALAVLQPGLKSSLLKLGGRTSL